MTGERPSRTPLPWVVVDQFRFILRDERIRQNRRQCDIADLVGTSRVSITEWEKGTVRPTPEHAIRWAYHLGFRLNFKAELTPLDPSAGEAVLLEQLTVEPIGRVRIRRQAAAEAADGVDLPG